MTKLQTILKQKRLEVQISQTALSELSKVSVATISNIEKGKTEPRGLTAYKLLLALGMSEDEALEVL